MIKWKQAPWVGVVRVCPECAGRNLRTQSSSWIGDTIRVSYMRCRKCDCRFTLTETLPKTVQNVS